jgi:hypothetical protein
VCWQEHRRLAPKPCQRKHSSRFDSSSAEMRGND